MNFKKTLRSTFLVVQFVLMTLPLTNCASQPRRGVVVTNCVSDPLTASLHCVDRNGVDSEVLWKDSGNYVCRPPAEDQVLVEQASRK